MRTWREAAWGTEGEGGVRGPHTRTHDLETWMVTNSLVPRGILLLLQELGLQ